MAPTGDASYDSDVSRFLMRDAQTQGGLHGAALLPSRMVDLEQGQAQNNEQRGPLVLCGISPAALLQASLSETQKRRVRMLAAAALVPLPSASLAVRMRANCKALSKHGLLVDVK